MLPTGPLSAPAAWRSLASLPDIEHIAATVRGTTN